jgi:CRP-like cAMP-binding protein
MITTEFDVEAIAAGEHRVRAFVRNAVIYRAGDASDCAYIIKRGEVEIRQNRGPVETLHAGEVFGEMGLLDGGTRTATAVAAAPSELVPIDRSLFASLIRDDEEFAMTVMRLMARRHRATIEMFQRCLDQPASLKAADG